jgi:hypothetical protein
VNARVLRPRTRSRLVAERHGIDAISGYAETAPALSICPHYPKLIMH